MDKTILVIDDEPVNQYLIQSYLEDIDLFKIITADDGVEGLTILEKEDENIDLILLDRMMPNMDGMEFMKRLKANPKFSSIPVIMQTAAAEIDEIAEGIKSGVYYYLTKPFEEEVLLSIISAALDGYAMQTELRGEVQKYRQCFGLTTKSTWEFRTLEESMDMAAFVASYFPEPERVVTGLSELFVNAVEHGNLGITYNDKSVLTANGNWKEEIQERLSKPEYSDKKVIISYERKEDEIEIVITDEGNGFDWENYLELSPERATHTHGRGIALSKSMSFDELEYQGNGNQVKCSVRVAKG